MSEKIEDLEKKTRISLTKDTTRMTNTNEPIRVDKKVGLADRPDHDNLCIAREFET